MSVVLDSMSERLASLREVVKRMFEPGFSGEQEEFGVTGDGELDLGPGAAAAELAAARGRGGDAGWDDWIDRGWEPGDYGDPETDPDDLEVFVAGMPAEVRADFLAGPFTGAEGPVPAGFVHHGLSGPSGIGFAAGGALDGMEPGPWLAKALDAATSAGHGGLGESELIGVLCGWRRMASWAAAGEAAAVVTLARRRAAASAVPGSSRLVEHVTDEVAAALTLTGRSAGRLLAVASGLGRLPEVHGALELGGIDWAKACVFADELAGVEDGELARGIAARFVGRAGAGGWTTGQLRAALRRAVLAADPGAAGRRQQDARAGAAVHAFGEASGNAGLAGRELPPAEVLAADARLTALAKWLRRRGAAGPIAQLRAAVYTALLTGRALTSLLDNPGPGEQAAATAAAPAGDTPGEVAGDADADPAVPAGASGWPAVCGSIHLVMPLSAFAGGGEPGEVAGHGPVDAATSRQLAAMLGQGPAARWCLTVTGPDGRAAGHACARRGPAAGQPAIAWAAGLRARLQLLETGPCGHARQAPGYVPPASLRHLIEVRQRTCDFPGCRRPAARCDLDHAIPYDQGGRTCECNLGPRCRRHHRAKQAPRWHLDQPEPGRTTWRLPSGRIYQTTAEPYPV